jgi:hypothetical protein
MSLRKIISLILAFLIIYSCAEQDDSYIMSQVETIQTPKAELSLVLYCDDTTSFKSQADLVPLNYWQDCFLTKATKEVPGLGIVPWIANARVWIYDGKINLGFNTFVPFFEEVYQRENLSIARVPLAVGIYPIYDNYRFQQNPESTIPGAYTRLGSDGDVLDGIWDIDTLCTNFVEISQLDLEDREVRGNFEMHLIMRQQGQFGVLYSERLRFLNGKFEARIIVL